MGITRLISLPSLQCCWMWVLDLVDQTVTIQSEIVHQQVESRLERKTEG
jgi:hypothetical protein